MAVSSGKVRSSGLGGWSALEPMSKMYLRSICKGVKPRDKEGTTGMGRPGCRPGGPHDSIRRKEMVEVEITVALLAVTMRTVIGEVLGEMAETT